MKDISTVPGLWYILNTFSWIYKRKLHEKNRIQEKSRYGCTRKQYIIKDI